MPDVWVFWRFMDDHVCRSAIGLNELTIDGPQLVIPGHRLHDSRCSVWPVDLQPLWLGAEFRFFLAIRMILSEKWTSAMIVVPMTDTPSALEDDRP